MTRKIRLLEGEQEFRTYVRICLNAYPSMTLPVDQLTERLMDTQKNDNASNYYGAFEDDLLVGGMRLLDFKLNYHGQMIDASGVGMVAVDLLQKKKGLAKDLINYYLDHYEQRDNYLALLYPFRPDFYYRMGFGYGTKMNQYDFCPASLPKGRVKGQLTYLKDEHKTMLKEFYNRHAQGVHGLCLKSDYEIESLFKAHADNNTLVGYQEDGALLGYLAFGFKKAHDNNFVRNNLAVREWMWNSPVGFAGLARFLHIQADQIERIVFNTQDEDFHFALSDVRHSSFNMIPSVYHQSNITGVGVMYRITNFTAFMGATAGRNFNGMDMNLSVQIQDTFRPENAGQYYLSFQGGQAYLSPVPLHEGVSLGIDIADLSSLLMGSVDFAALHRLGRVDVDASRVEDLNALFRVERKPQCITAF